MDNEAKVTYSVIAILILFLGGLAYVLQPMGVEESTQVATSTNTKKEGSQPLQSNTQSTTTKPMNEEKKFTSAVITTSKGVIEVELSQATPITTKNFGTLANSGFYNGVRFHRVIKNFMIQTGDPLSKDKAKMGVWGTGGPGYKFNDELTGSEKYPLGTLAMANSGANTNGSQFFIVTATPGAPLPASYTVFGKVTKGIQVAEAIQNVQTTGTPYDRPVDDIIVEKIQAK